MILRVLLLRATRLALLFHRAVRFSATTGVVEKSVSFLTVWSNTTSPVSCDFSSATSSGMRIERLMTPARSVTMTRAVIVALMTARICGDRRVFGSCRRRGGGYDDGHDDGRSTEQMPLSDQVCRSVLALLEYREASHPHSCAAALPNPHACKLPRRREDAGVPRFAPMKRLCASSAPHGRR